MENRIVNKFNKKHKKVNTAIILNISNCRIIPLREDILFHICLYCSDINKKQINQLNID